MPANIAIAKIYPNYSFQHLSRFRQSPKPYLKDVFGIKRLVKHSNTEVPGYNAGGLTVIKDAHVILCHIMIHRSYENSPFRKSNKHNLSKFILGVHLSTMQSNIKQ